MRLGMQVYPSCAIESHKVGGFGRGSGPHWLPPPIGPRAAEGLVSSAKRHDVPGEPAPGSQGRGLWRHQEATLNVPHAPGSSPTGRPRIASPSRRVRRRASPPLSGKRRTPPSARRRLGVPRDALGGRAAVASGVCGAVEAAAVPCVRGGLELASCPAPQIGTVCCRPRNLYARHGCGVVPVSTRSTPARGSTACGSSLSSSSPCPSTPSVPRPHVRTPPEPFGPATTAAVWNWPHASLATGRPSSCGTAVGAATSLVGCELWPS